MRILLVEDDQPTSEVLADILTGHHYSIDCATAGTAPTGKIHACGYI
jgi:DNA-binding response OmpR family regulator